MQYAEFFNAVAATDTNGLYNSFMGTDPRGVSSGIDHVSYSTNGSDQEFVGGHAGNSWFVDAGRLHRTPWLNRTF